MVSEESTAGQVMMVEAASALRLHTPMETLNYDLPNIKGRLRYAVVEGGVSNTSSTLG
jgi:hypothetical protein